MEELLALLKSNIENLKQDFYIMQNIKYKNAVLWHVPSLSVYALDSLNTELFTSLIRVSSENELGNWVEKNKLRLFDLKEDIKFMLTYTQNTRKDSKDLFKLCLLVSQQCPLKCIYCYAKEGTYGNPSYMNIETACKTINVFSQIFDSIYGIQFFGGEPLLNLDVIEKTINFVNYLIRQGKIRKKPQISIESGLAISSENMERFINLLKKYPEIYVVVSCDGPKEVQDTLRRYKNGEPSFDIVSKNIDLLREYDQPKTVEVTYTKIHQNKKISPLDLRNFFQERFKISNIMMADVMSKDPSIIVDTSDKDYLQSRYSVEEVLKRDPTSFFCEMGFSSFAVDTKGDIYPCQMLVGIDKFKVGNIYYKTEKLKDKILEASKLYRIRANKSQYEECNHCYLKYFCGDCPSGNYFLNGTMKKTFKNCYSLKEEIEELVLQYANGIKL